MKDAEVASGPLSEFRIPNTAAGGHFRVFRVLTHW